MGQAIAFEGKQAEAAHEHEGAPVVSRTMQRSLGSDRGGGLRSSFGGFFALAFAAVYGRVVRASPARTSIWLAAARS